jgi:hypothetical protein
MAYWDGTTIVRSAPEPYDGFPGWLRIDCGCCNGLRWSAVEPEVCADCDGAGSLAQHIASGRISRWPGGPFIGRAPKEVTP